MEKVKRLDNRAHPRGFDEKIKILSHQGYTVSEIAQQVGFTQKGVTFALYRLGISAKSLPSGKPGPKGPHKRPSKRVLEMIEMVNSGSSCAEVALRFGVTTQAVWGSVKKWKERPGFLSRDEEMKPKSCPA